MLLLGVVSAETSHFPVCELMVLLLFCAFWIYRQLTLSYRAGQHVVLKSEALSINAIFVIHKNSSGWV